MIRDFGGLGEDLSKLWARPHEMEIPVHSLIYGARAPQETPNCPSQYPHEKEEEFHGAEQYPPRQPLETPTWRRRRTTDHEENDNTILPLLVRPLTVNEFDSIVGRDSVSSVGGSHPFPRRVATGIGWRRRQRRRDPVSIGVLIPTPHK